jgi:hypothetical protein
MVKQASSVFSVDVTGLDGALGQPAHVRICDRIRIAIISGALAPNARLPYWALQEDAYAIEMTTTARSVRGPPDRIVAGNRWRWACRIRRQLQQDPVPGSEDRLRHRSRTAHRRLCRCQACRRRAQRIARPGSAAAFIHEGHLARHLRKTRAIYDERRLAFLEEAKILADVLDFGPARAGMHVTGLFKAGISRRLDDRSVAAECARSGVEVHPLSKYGATDRGGLVFGFAAASRAAARSGLQVVRRAITT